jgi:hypothetical protein
VRIVVDIEKATVEKNTAKNLKALREEQQGARR